MTSPRPLEIPWWLEAGPQLCVFCLCRYHDEAGYYCSDCDRPVCPACAIEIRTTGGIVCPDCHAAATTDGDG